MNSLEAYKKTVKEDAVETVKQILEGWTPNEVSLDKNTGKIIISVTNDSTPLPRDFDLEFEDSCGDIDTK